MHKQINAKQALDRIIKISRVHLYKPIQIAEILHQHRAKRGWDLMDLESYRNISKKWRDEISLLLVGRRSTSSQKYQDNVFEANAIPPKLLKELGTINKKGKGYVEAYIYKALEQRLSSVREVEDYIKTSSPDVFSIKKIVSLFKKIPGLRRSIDKMYEILVYALFATIVRHLKAQITLEIGNKDSSILKDFESFIKMVLGIDSNQMKIVMPAALFRVGVTNAADRGLDIWSNFGPAIQVKHLTLTPELVENMVDEIMADKIVIVCVDKEKTSIEFLLKQVGWSDRIQGIITINDLNGWYQLCLSKKYRGNLGANLIKDIQREFDAEFPSSKEIVPFMKKRGYDKIAMPTEWKIES
ncbi:HaeII family restriction endonuclease [Patescibacteria group bacterium]|nr:HaeII family restriction endonuclease [Patescibacteria group bacterium]